MSFGMLGANFLVQVQAIIVSWKKCESVTELWNVKFRHFLTNELTYGYGMVHFAECSSLRSLHCQNWGSFFKPLNVAIVHLELWKISIFIDFLHGSHRCCHLLISILHITKRICCSACLLKAGHKGALEKGWVWSARHGWLAICISTPFSFSPCLDYSRYFLSLISRVVETNFSWVQKIDDHVTIWNSLYFTFVNL